MYDTSHFVYPWPGRQPAGSGAIPGHLPDLDLIGVEYPQQYPWDALPVIQAAYEEASRTHSQIWLLANSIGAYFGMLALQDRPIEKALLISPSWIWSV